MEITFNPDNTREVHHTLETLKRVISDLNDEDNEWAFDYTFKVKRRDWVGYKHDKETELYSWGEWKTIGEES